MRDGQTLNRARWPDLNERAKLIKVDLAVV